jgi:hypothetical protein
MSILEHSVEEIWNMPQWDITDDCHACEHLACIWFSSQGISTVAEPYIRGVSLLIKNQLKGMNFS